MIYFINMTYLRSKKAFQVAFVIAVTFSFSSCHIFDNSDEKVVISVGSRDITKGELKENIEDIAGDMGVSGKELELGIRPIINKIVENYLIMEYGREAGIKLSGKELALSIKELTEDYPGEVFKKTLLENAIEYDSWEKSLRRKLLIEKITQKAIGDTDPITFEETKEYYNSNLDDFIHPMMVKLRQIVVKTEEEANSILARLNEGEDMGALAKEYSITPEAADGGVMGWIAKGHLEEGIEDVLFNLPSGKRSGVLKSSYGYHIFEVIETRDEGYYTLPEAMEKIERSLTFQKRELSYGKWISDLKDRYPVKIQEDIYTSWDK